MKSAATFMALILITGTVLTGCVSSRSGKVYSRDQARVAQSVEWGTLRHIEYVKIEGTKSGAGAVGGAVAGGIAGSTAGKGKGSTLFALGGALVGAIIGAFTEEAVTSSGGVELTVQLDSGKTNVYVQEDDEQWVVGDRVRVVRAPDGTTRIRH